MTVMMSCVILLSLVVMIVVTASLLWRQRALARRKISLHRATEIAQSFTRAMAKFEYEEVLRVMSPWAFSVDDIHTYAYGQKLQAYITQACVYLSVQCSGKTAVISHDLRRIDPETFIDVASISWLDSLSAVYYLIIKYNGVVSALPRASARIDVGDEI